MGGGICKLRTIIHHWLAGGRARWAGVFAIDKVNKVTTWKTLPYCTELDF